MKEKKKIGKFAPKLTLLNRVQSKEEMEKITGGHKCGCYWEWVVSCHVDKTQTAIRTVIR